jgi:type II secretory pathway pseudopilin PulG
MTRVSSRGYTVIELVIGMLIVLILGTVAFLSYQPDPIKARYQAGRLRADLRHAQMLASTLAQPLRVTAVAGLGGTYSVSAIGGIGTGVCTLAALNDPATGAAFSAALDPALTLGGPATLDFDTLGRPASCSGNPCACAISVASDPVASYTVSGGGTTVQIDVNRLSGFATGAP